MNRTDVMTSPALDAGAFAAEVLHAPLWRHQLEVVRSPARYRVICAGRQVGKSRMLAVEALFTAATRADVLVLVVSAGETAARRLLEECAALAEGSPALRGSVVEQSTSLLALSNGSTIRAVPASSKQIRGWPVDLLILDEAGFIDQEIWRSAEPSVIARPGSRVILCSSPWGGTDHFYRQLWRRGMDDPNERVASWHWPSSTSPMVDEALLADIRARETPEYFHREFLAEWTDASGAYFSEAEIMACVADYGMLDAAAARDASPFLDGHGALQVFPAVAGVDWGMRRDSNVVALVSPLDDYGLNDELLGVGQRPLYVPWIYGRPQWAYDDFCTYVVDFCRSYKMIVAASEINGVGDAATAMLQQALRDVDVWVPVAEVWTDNRRKQAGFGKLRTLMQRRRLVLPRHPELLRQLRALETEQLPSGSLRIAVPDNIGHDDYAMALMQAVSCVFPAQPTEHLDPRGSWHTPAPDDGAYELTRTAARADVTSHPDRYVSTPSGLRLPRRALPLRDVGNWAGWPQGQEKGEGW